ncbi:hypothetical protein BUALT_Bualt02G0087100 [Buddleja alternifolia]|uniref:Uncharacterized protein n=1 Tax=Buddleja alternifolia TaxID=168488 RepID=A0AAV6Y6L6_9LAMI|nr:hypothetical protein BUALT_Bualt02G0087100 [Buddleja alternifolia]
MAPTIPIDYTGQREPKKFTKPLSWDTMGKTRKVSKNYPTGFVPDYRHAVETVAESEGFGSSGRVDAELTASEDSFAPNRKCISLNEDGYDRSVVPVQVLSLSKMSHLERRDLEVRLKSELEEVRKLQRKIASFSLDKMVRPPTTDFHSFQNVPKRPAMVESLPMPSNDSPMVPGKKKCPPGRNGPRTKGGAMSARRNESMNRGLPQNTNFLMLMKQCETLLDRLMGHTHGWIFKEPVDIIKHNIPDYFNVIKHPMDLGTIKSKLRTSRYTSPMEFAEDVRLTFKNAMTYNPPGHDVYVMADILSKLFEVRWKAIEKKIPSTADESTASKSSVIIEPESAYVPPAKKQKTASIENKVKHERDKRVMSDSEKEKLGAELEDLLAELPENILDFLKQSTLNASQVSEDEIEIDMDAVSDDTLFVLRKLLDDYLLEKQRKQAISEPCEIEMREESGFTGLPVQPCKENEPADEDVDIGGNEPPPISSSPDKDTVRRNSNCSSSRSSSRESGSSSNDTDSESSSTSELNGAKNAVPATIVNEMLDTRAERKESDLGDPNNGDFLNEQNSGSNSSYIEPNCRQDGESAPPERQVSPDKLYRAALLRSRFADIIIKAQENSNEKGERPDPEKLKLEREELQRRRKEEKARLQAEAKAAEEAKKKIELEAAAEAKRKRELEREAARQALLKMEKTVDINENSQFMEDLEMFTAAPDEHLRGFTEEASPENSQNGLGSFKFGASSNPLEQLGLYMKNDEEEEEEVEPQSAIQHTSNDPEEEEVEPQSVTPHTSNDPEEGEID